MTNQKINKSKIKVTRNFVIAIFIILIILFSWAGLTKAGYINNYLGVEIFCSEPKELNQPELNEPFQSGGLNFDPDSAVAFKPVIYLYPQELTNVLIKLDYKGEIIADYPDYDYSINGWNVLAYPDGRLINNLDHQEYSYIFWEGKPSKKINYELSEGFIVSGDDTKTFLQNKLSKIGLTPKEYNEFIVYWYPRMKDNNYNLIHFAGKEYTDTAPLAISPKPDSILRVFMVFKPLNAPVDVKPQEIKKFNRKGFTVVEWGGAELK